MADENKNSGFERDAFYMRRALQLAVCGLGNVSPNPLVGAVIVAPGDVVIGEGFHRQYGGPHAEVNAVNSVSPADRALLPQSTIYVTLEPCSHYGKTPPCSLLLRQCGFRRVVIGTVDPFDKVAGKGIAMLREVGISVDTGILERECRCINARFFTAHTLHRPFVTLKWAQSADGFMDTIRNEGMRPYSFSSAVGKMLVHRLRAHHDAIAVGSGTFLADSPRLDVRHWHGQSPRPVIFDRRGRCGAPSADIPDTLRSLYNDGVTSVLVEGGPTLLRSFLNLGLWDLVRVEVAPVRLGHQGAASAPTLSAQPFAVKSIGENTILYYSNNKLVDNYFIDNGL